MHYYTKYSFMCGNICTYIYYHMYVDILLHVQMYILPHKILSLNIQMYFDRFTCTTTQNTPLCVVICVHMYIYHCIYIHTHYCIYIYTDYHTQRRRRNNGSIPKYQKKKAGWQECHVSVLLCCNLCTPKKGKPGRQECHVAFLFLLFPPRPFLFFQHNPKQKKRKNLGGRNAQSLQRLLVQCCPVEGLGFSSGFRFQ